MKKLLKWLIGIVVVVGVVGGIGNVADFNQANNANSNSSEAASVAVMSTPVSSLELPQEQETAIPVEQEHAPEIIEKTETKYSEVAYQTITRGDATLEVGVSKVMQDGRTGTREETYQVTYTDGVETGRKLVNSRISVEPQNRVIHNGTYVRPRLNCQNGSYTNSNGQEVCSPSTVNNGGATAICRDGTYSYSQHRRGTCSHHGGVAQWL